MNTHKFQYRGLSCDVAAVDAKKIAPAKLELIQHIDALHDAHHAPGHQHAGVCPFCTKDRRH